MKSAAPRKRGYRMRARAEAVAQTRERILRSAYELWLAETYDAVTMNAVAARAGVTRQTVLRQFSSKDELAVAVVDWQRPREEAGRQTEPGDAAAAVARLVARYEVMGDGNVRMLEVERRIPAIRYLLEQSRESHRGWIERVFSPALPKRRGPARERRILALYAATDVYLWKLLRRDLGVSAAEAEAVLGELVEAVLGRRA
jgi:AcrR family transcriptional regulator